MSLLRRRSRMGATLSLAVVLAGACAEGTASPLGLELAAPIDASVLATETTVGSGLLDDYTQWFRRIWVCKVGTDAEFLVSVNGAEPTSVSLVANQCKMVHYMDSQDQERQDTVVVTELASSETVLDSIVVDSTHSLTKYRLPTITGTNIARTYTFRSKGAIATFYNSVAPPPPPPPTTGGEGCTPGYWKQRQHFGSWTSPYSPNKKFSTVFSNAFPGKTLLQVLGQGGGGLNALGRHTVAALLNAASAGVEYDLTVAQVIADFNEAYANGDYEDLKDTFADLNEQGCPLGRDAGGNGGHYDNDDCDGHGHRIRNRDDHHHRSAWDRKNCKRWHARRP